MMNAFAQRFAAQFGRAVPEIDDDALAAIRAHHWPGNVRELRNVVERAVVMAEGPDIMLQDLPPELQAGIATTDNAPVVVVPALVGRNPARRNKKVDKAERLKREREMLVRALADARGNKAEAARTVGLPRGTFLSKLKKLGLQ